METCREILRDWLNHSMGDAIDISQNVNIAATKSCDVGAQ